MIGYKERGGNEIKGLLSKFLYDFIDARTPVANKITLSQNKIYIIPTQYGVIMLWVIVALAGVGVNYGNSMILGLAYLLVSFFIIAIWHTYRNLSGLTIQSTHTQNGFMGDALVLKVNLSASRNRTYETVSIIWEGVRKTVTIAGLKDANPELLIPVNRRGYFKPGRLRVETTFPVGLLVGWSYARFDVGGWVYPKPIQNKHLTAIRSGSGDTKNSVLGGTEDFFGVRHYMPGDSLKQIDWKVYAKENALYTKQFVDPVDHSIWLDWQNFSGAGDELAYSYMCYWVLIMTERKQTFGIRLPNKVVELNSGEPHKMRCLLALAQA